MSIQALNTKGLINVNQSVDSTNDSDVTIAFALDSGYLDCFKVMLASMATNGVFCNSPIAVYSDDEQLFNDPIVKLVTDKPVLLSGKRKEILYSLAQHNVKRPERADWNRGTFLKWCVFEPQETTRLLFLDVDMLTLQSMNPLLRLYPDTPLVTCPQFQQSLRTGNVEQNLYQMLDGDFDSKHKRRINSGVMLINRELLSNDFFDAVTSFASQRVSIHEQGHLSEYFYSKPEMLAMAPSGYNYQESYLRLLKGEPYQDVLSKVAVLHYAGKAKPWKEEFSDLLALPSMSVWHHYKRLAAEILAVRC